MSDKIIIEIPKEKLPNYFLLIVLVITAVLGYNAVSKKSNTSQPVVAGSTGSIANADDMSSHHGGGGEKKKFESLAVGVDAPQFSLPSTVGKTIALSDYKGKNVLLFFNEGVMCSPCWQEIERLERFKDDFDKTNTVIIPISVDDQKTWDPIIASEKITTPILIDTDRKVSSAYKALGTPSSMHSDRAGHTYIHVDKNQKIHSSADFPGMSVQASVLLDHLKGSL